jgi:tRNA 2-thiocytidine biosynthesis protein TtcA
MKNILTYNRNFGTWFANDVLRAIKRYGLIERDESIAVAVSGGKDSTVLLYIMAYLRRYSSLKFTVTAAHVKTADYDTRILRDLCDELSIPYRETTFKRPSDGRVKNHCYVCARLKRGALHELLSAQGIKKIALGHHATDVAETFLMNITEHKKLGSFCPRVEADKTGLTLIRPLVYLDEATITRIHRHLGLPLLSYECPYADGNLRACYKERLETMEKLLGVKDLSKRIVASLENVDSSNSWKAVRKIVD